MDRCDHEEKPLIDINTRGKSENSPLILAARNGHSNVVEAILVRANTKVDIMAVEAISGVKLCTPETRQN